MEWDLPSARASDLIWGGVITSASPCKFERAGGVSMSRKWFVSLLAAASLVKNCDVQSAGGGGGEGRAGESRPDKQYPPKE